MRACLLRKSLLWRFKKREIAVEPLGTTQSKVPSEWGQPNKELEREGIERQRRCVSVCVGDVWLWRREWLVLGVQRQIADMGEGVKAQKVVDERVSKQVKEMEKDGRDR